MGSSSVIFGAMVVVAAWSTGPGTAGAQVRASERGTVSQLVDGTLIEVSYGRPRLRGRTAFGGVVQWGEMWTPGANWATTFAVSKPVRLNGFAVPAGRYSVWIVPTVAEWTLYLQTRAKRYHLERPTAGEMFVAIPVAPVVVPPVDLLTFSFPETRRDGATLRFQWGPTALSLAIDVEATAPRRPKLTAGQVAPYLGTYVAWLFSEHGDSTMVRMRLSYEDGRLAGLYNDGPGRFELFPAAKAHQFWIESHDAEGPRDVELDGPVAFRVDRKGRAIGFQMPGIEQPLWLRGVRAVP